MRRVQRRLKMVPVVLGLCIAISGCSGQSSRADGSPKPGVSGVSYTLYTHCGIDKLEYNGLVYRRIGGSLNDGHGNPPKGWGNPQQSGHLSLSSGNKKVTFTDASGHRETFVLDRSTSQSSVSACS